MYIILSLFVCTIGAILRFAVNEELQGINLQDVGLILLIAGGVGFILAVIAEVWQRQQREKRFTETQQARQEYYEQNRQS